MSVTCHISFVMCQVSGVTIHEEKKENVRGLSVEGLLSTGHNLKSVIKLVFRLLDFVNSLM